MYTQHIPQAAETSEEFLIETVTCKQYCQLIPITIALNHIFAFSNIKGRGIKFITVNLFKAIYLQENVIEIKVSNLLDDDK